MADSEAAKKAAAQLTANALKAAGRGDTDRAKELSESAKLANRIITAGGGDEPK